MAIYVFQVEFYFSDANILKDAFLLKHVRRNKLGYVSLKLITSFRKVKSLTKDYRVVAFSLRQSEGLEVNEEGTKVRRKNALPDYDETTPSRTVVVVNLPFENPTIENVAELFSKCGDISLIRVLRPGKSIPPDVKKHINKHPELGNTVCAVIEFETHESAKQACEEMTNSDDWRKGMRVVLLATPKSKKDKSNDRRDNDVESRDNNNTTKEGAGDASCGESNRQRKKRNKKKHNVRVEEVLSAGDGGAYSSGSEADGDVVGKRPDSGNQRRSSAPAGSQLLTRQSLSPKQDPNRLSPNTSPRVTPRSSPRNSPRSSPRTSPNMRRRNLHGKSPLAQEGLSPGTSPRPSPCASPELRRRSGSGAGNDPGTSPSQSPWVQRRLKAQQETSPLAVSPGASPRLGRRLADGTLMDGPGRLADMEGVIRQPSGPDGSPGFYNGVGRGKPPIGATA